MSKRPTPDAGDFGALVKSLAGATVEVNMLRRRTDGVLGEELRVEILRRLEVTLLRAGAATMGFSPETLPTSVAGTRESSTHGLLPVEEFNALLGNLDSLRKNVAILLIEDENSGFEDAMPEDPLIRAALRELNSGLEEIFGEVKGQGN